MTAAAVAAAGLPEMVLPTRRWVLPPRFGWRPHEVSREYMREVEQYLITSGTTAFRYDAVGRDLWGNERQIFIEAPVPCASVARGLISERFAENGLTAIHPDQAREFILRLPRYVPGQYV